MIRLKEMETIEIAACTDHRYIMPTGVMIHSVCKNNKDQKVRFHIIVDESVTEEDRNDLRDVAERNAIHFYEVDSQLFRSMPVILYISRATYYRLLIPQILSEDIHKVLFLDCDIIVRHSLLPLWETDVDGYALAAVPDDLDSVIATYNRLKYPPRLGYFNAGVLLLNLRYWRANNIHSEIQTYMKNHFEDILFSDQDILNYVLRERKRPLPIKYNLQTAFLFIPRHCGCDYWKYEKEILEARKDPVIVHFTAGKPWKEGCYHPYQSTFLKYQDETKWKGCIWRNPKRPFMVKVRSHLKNMVPHLKGLLAEMGLLKAASGPQGIDLFANGLQPID